MSGTKEIDMSREPYRHTIVSIEYDDNGNIWVENTKIARLSEIPDMSLDGPLFKIFMIYLASQALITRHSERGFEGQKYTIEERLL